jgi:hypothetical protein
VHGPEACTTRRLTLKLGALPSQRRHHPILALCDEVPPLLVHYECSKPDQYESAIDAFITLKQAQHSSFISIYTYLRAFLCGLSRNSNQSADKGENFRANQLLCEADAQLPKLRAMPFLLTSLMRCNKCGEGLSAEDHVHVIDVVQ